MPDITISGIGSLTSANNPLASKPGSLIDLTNMNTDMPGWAIKRRGIKQLNATSGYTSVLSGAMTAVTTLPVCSWSFDDHVFLYVEDSTSGGSAIVAYSMVTSAGWHKVVESTSKLRPDANQFKMRTATSDRRMLISTNTGVKRIPSIYDNYYPKGSTTAVNYSTMYRDAGVPRALDPRCRNAVAGGATDHGLIALTGFEWLNLSSATAYRVAWFKRDENGIPTISAPSGRVVVRNTSTTTNYATRLKIPIPDAINDSSYVLQIYRTNIIEMDGAGVIPDPGDDCFLAGEYRLTTTDLSNGYVLYEDISIDTLLGDALYSNQNQEGNEAARYQPPMCRDVASFGGCTFFSNVTERQRLVIKILAVDSSGIGTFKGTTVGDKIVVGDLVMEAVTLANEEVQGWYFATDATTGAGSEVIRAIKTAESLAYKYNMWSNTNNGRYAAYNMTTNNDIYGVVMLEEKSVGGSTGVYLGVNRVDAPVQILPAPVFTTTPSNTRAQACSVATNVANTLVTLTYGANHNLTTNDLIFLAPFGTTTVAGTSSPKLTNTDVPSGVYQVTVTGATTATFPAPSGTTGNQNDAAGATTGGYAHKIFDVTTSVWTEARSKNSFQSNRLMWSAPFEPECAPPANTTDIGAADKQILRIVPTQDSLFIFKEDGLWRLKGLIGDWEITVLDKACILAAPESPGVVEARIFAYTTNGIASIDDGGSMKISNPVGGLVDNFYRAQATYPSIAITYSGVGHGEEQAYWLSFGSDIVRYHTVTRTWSRHFFDDDFNSSGSASYSNLNTVKASRYTSFDNQAYAERLLVCFDLNDCIGIERKTGRASELCDLDIPVTASSFDSSASTFTLASVPSSVDVGDMLIWYDVSSYTPGNYGSASAAKYRATITAINGNVLSLDVSGNVTPMSSWPAVSGAMAASVVNKITSRIAFAPIGPGGSVPAHFSEVGFTCGSRGNFSTVIPGFTTETGYPTNLLGSEQSNSSVNGYYNSLFSQTSIPINRAEQTMPAIMAFRSGVPRASAMATSIMFIIEHARAFEQFDLAGIRLSYEQGDNRARRTNA